MFTTHATQLRVSIAIAAIAISGQINTLLGTSNIQDKGCTLFYLKQNTIQVPFRNSHWSPPELEIALRTAWIRLVSLPIMQ